MSSNTNTSAAMPTSVNSEERTYCLNGFKPFGGNNVWQWSIVGPSGSRIVATGLGPLSEWLGGQVASVSGNSRIKYGPDKSSVSRAIGHSDQTFGDKLGTSCTVKFDALPERGWSTRVLTYRPPPTTLDRATQVSEPPPDSEESPTRQSAGANGAQTREPQRCVGVANPAARIMTFKIVGDMRKGGQDQRFTVYSQHSENPIKVNGQEPLRKVLATECNSAWDTKQSNTGPGIKMIIKSIRKSPEWTEAKTGDPVTVTFQLCAEAGKTWKAEVRT